MWSHAYQFWKKIHPLHTFPPSTFIDFLDFFHPPLHVYCIYVLLFSKNPTLQVKFQPPRLLILQLLHPLQVYSNLHGYKRDESTFSWDSKQSWWESSTDFINMQQQILLRKWDIIIESVVSKFPGLKITANICWKLP